MRSAATPGISINHSSRANIYALGGSLRSLRDRRDILAGKHAPNNSQPIRVRIEDAQGHCGRARQNGAMILTEPQDHACSERRYNAHDFHGHHLDFTETITDVAPEQWSGGAFYLQ